MTKTPQGPTVPGTMWHERVRLAPGCWMHIDSVATDVEPPRRLGMNFCSRYFSGHLNYDVTATEEGSVLRQRQILVPRRLLQRAGPWIQQRLGPRLQVRLRDIKSLLEAQPPNPAR